MTCVVYGLSSSEDGVIRYIGQTVKAPERRLLAHKSQAKRRRAAVHHWICKVFEHGHALCMTILIDNAEWAVSERMEIEKRRSAGERLLNLTDGGDGIPGAVRSDETRRKISEARKGMKFSEEHCESMSLCRMGRTPSLAAIEKQRAKMKGRTPKNLKDLHEAKRGIPRSEETKAKISASLRGRKSTLSPEMRAKVAAAARASCLGVPKSAETRAKISATKLARRTV